MRDSVVPGFSGGGIINLGTLTMLDSAVVGNSTAGAGSGILNEGTMRLTNVTVSGNQSGLQGGGIDQAISGTTTLEHVTISDNTGDRDVSTFGAGGLTVEDGTVTLRNTIIAGNQRGFGTARKDCWGTITTLGHNLIGQIEPCVIIGGPAGDLLNQPADLGDLVPNGGPTPTHALLPGSLAIDAAGGHCPSTDQRRVLRPQGPRCDIGTYERGGAAPPAVDFDGDGQADVVVGAGRGFEPRVVVLSGATGNVILSLLAYGDGSQPRR